MSDVVRVGVLGCGNVGAPLIALLQRRVGDIAARTGLHLEVTKVAVRSASETSTCPPARSPPTPARWLARPTSTSSSRS
jgi:homoserine dehydrogenase